MALLTTAECQAHCRADSGEETILLSLLASAEDAAKEYLNRAIHPDAAARDAAMAAYPDAVAAAHVAYDQAIEDADLEQTTGDANKAQAMRDVAKLKLSTAIREAERSANGIVTNPSILAAVKLTLGHLYANREAVTEIGMAELPLGVAALLRPYRLVQMP